MGPKDFHSIMTNCLSILEFQSLNKSVLTCSLITMFNLIIYSPKSIIHALEERNQLLPLVTILETNYKLFTMDYEHKVASLGLINILRKYCFWDSEPDMIAAFPETKTLLEPCLFNLIRILNVSLVKSRVSKTSHNETEQDNRNEAALNYWDIEMMKRQKLLKHDKPKNNSQPPNQEIPSQDPLGQMPINFASLGGGFDCIGNKVFRKFSDDDSDAGNSSDDYDYNDFGYFFFN
jgi:hypothetical protein